jgi:hypothetical protein
MAESDKSGQQQQKHPILRVLVWLVVIVVLVAGASTTAFFYLAHAKPALLGQAIASINKIADSLDDRERAASADKLRNLGEFLNAHSDDIDAYGKDVDEKLVEIRKQSERAYQAAKKKIDEYRAERSRK